jgi:hypothetical protein
MHGVGRPGAAHQHFVAMKSLSLTYRLGAGRNSPTTLKMQTALVDLFEETKLGLPEGDLIEHRKAWLTLCGDVGQKWPILTVDGIAEAL